MANPKEYGDAPVKVLAAIHRWVEYRDYPGGFVTRMLCNDLSGTLKAADPQSLAALPTLLRYLHNEVPALCWGSEEKVTAWNHGPAPTTVDTDHLLLTATQKTLESYLAAAHDVGEAKGLRESQ